MDNYYSISTVYVTKEYNNNYLPFLISLDSSIENHAIIRPIQEKLFSKTEGNWSELDIFNHASKYFESFIQKGEPMKIDQDVIIWVQMYLHKVMLNMDMGCHELSKFVEMQKKTLIVEAALPQFTHSCCLFKSIFKVEEVKEFRESQIQKYMPFLNAQPELDHLTTNEEMYFVACHFFDILMFAGGLSVPRIIVPAIAKILSSKGELTHFNSEVIRNQKLFLEKCCSVDN